MRALGCSFAMGDGDAVIADVVIANAASCLPKPPRLEGAGAGSRLSQRHAR
jgi:hypothetical protein